MIDGAERLAYHGADPGDIIAAGDVTIDEVMSWQPPAWHADAACRGMDTEAFFPSRGQSRQARDAIAICDNCAVQAECLAAACADPTLQGVWGGATAIDRQRMRGVRPPRRHPAA